MRLLILYGTETGNSQFLAEDLVERLLKDGHDAIACNMEDASIPILSDWEIVLIVTSTYGEGQLPASASSFHKTLTEQQPCLSKVRYGVFGLGDKTYAETFGKGAETFDTLFAKLGALRIVQREVHDALSRESPDSHAMRWLENLMLKSAETAARPRPLLENGIAHSGDGER